MNGIEKKSLEHVKELLDSYETYKTWKVLNEVLINNKIDGDIARFILNAFDDSIRVQSDIVKNAKSWVEVLIKEKE